MKSIRLSLLVFALFALNTTFAQKPAVFSIDGKAIRGYDPVAYFTDGKPVKGDSTLTADYDGATWVFATAAHRDAFKAEPAKYAPQYGGYCAFGTSRGYKAPTEADAFTIVNDKLYLNYNTKVRTEWNKDQPGYIQKADTNWLTIRDNKPKQ